MSIFSFLGDIFSPLSDIIDEIHSSDEEMGNIDVKKREIHAKIAEIEAKVTTQMIKLQMSSIEAQTKMEASIQKHGNWFTRAVRPMTHLMSFIIIILMGLGYMTYSELIIKICGGYLGIYAGLRTYEKKK